MTFRAAATNDNGGTAGTAISITVPGSVVDDDLGSLLVVWVGTTGETPPTCTAESGTGNTWSTTLAPRTDGNMGWAVLTRKQATGDAGTVDITLGNARLLTVAAVWESAVTAVGVVGTVGSRAGVSGSTVVAPSITAGDTGRTILGLFAERTTAAGTTVTTNVGTTRAYREGAGTSTGSALVVEFTAAVAATGAVTATYSSASGNGAGVLIELQPVVVIPPGAGDDPGFSEGFTFGLGPAVVVTPPGGGGGGSPSPVPPGDPTAPPGDPARWVWVIGPWNTGPDTYLPLARNRRVTWRRVGRSEASFEIDGLEPGAAGIDELITDLWVIRYGAPGIGRTLFRGRIGPTADNLDGSGHAVTVSAGDYRAVLDRRQFWEGGTLSFLNQDQALLAWNIVQHTQLQTAGGLGIVRGTGQTTGQVRVRNDYPPGKPIGEALDQLAQVENGFDWDITPHVDPRNRTLYLDVFFPTRGTDRGVVLDYGGRLISVQRQVDPGQYANAIRGTGADSTSSGGVLAPVRREASGLLTRPEGRWDGSMSDPDLVVAQTIVERTNRELTDRQIITPSYTVTLRPNSWAGPDDVWLGDPARLIVRWGRLNVDVTLQVQEVTAAFDEDDTVTVSLTLGPIERPNKRWSVRALDQRLRALERR